jgi:hypothetical protein
MPATKATRRSKAISRRRRAHQPTPQQVAYLKRLSREVGLPYMGGLSRAEVSREIATLLWMKRKMTAGR